MCVCVYSLSNCILMTAILLRHIFPQIFKNINYNKFNLNWEKQRIRENTSELSLSSAFLFTLFFLIYFLLFKSYQSSKPISDGFSRNYPRYRWHSYSNDQEILCLVAIFVNDLPVEINVHSQRQIIYLFIQEKLIEPGIMLWNLRNLKSKNNRYCLGHPGSFCFEWCCSLSESILRI